MVSTAAEEIKQLMEYRYLGGSGLKVSVISFGNMIVEANGNIQKTTNDIVKKCLDYGVNYFDTAEFYDDGNSEIYLG